MFEEEYHGAAADGYDDGSNPTVEVGPATNVSDTAVGGPLEKEDTAESSSGVSVEEEESGKKVV